MNKNKDQEKIKLSIDMMHYKNNRISFWLIILTIALNIAMFLIIYTTTACTSGVQLGIDLLINVIFMLACFLAAEKTKRYSKQWGVTSIIIGIVEICRIFWIPLYYFLNNGLSKLQFSFCVVLLILAGASLIVAGHLTLYKYNILIHNEPLINKEGAKKDVRT